MLFMAPDASKLERVQGTWVHDDEINRVIRYWKGIRSLEDSLPVGVGAPSSDAPPSPAATDEGLDDEDALPPLPALPAGDPSGMLTQPPLFAQIDQLKAHDARDELFDQAVQVVRAAGRGSVSLLQRKLRIGYSRASRLVDQLEEAGILGPDLGGNQGRAVIGVEDDSAPTPPPTGPTPHIIGGAGDDEEAGPSSVRPRVWM
jgi:S-DNA-T family DNA segregation ATPase FtsK/SpoIIIE